MIFLTVGHQTPFDRLVRAVDEWANEHRDIQVFGQIGEGAYEPTTFPYERWLSSERFEEVLSASSAVVSHAGTGTILQVLMQNKPLLVLPRRAAQNETRNDHQVGTARHFAERNLVMSIVDETLLPAAMQDLLDWRPARGIEAQASPELIARLHGFINDS